MSERYIPGWIKREVRQQCLFGCAICGSPFFEYDHIDEFADVKKHEADNLVLMCPNHHSSKTTHKLSKERVRAAKQTPFNSTRQFTGPFQLVDDENIMIELGSNLVEANNIKNGVFPAIWVNGSLFMALNFENGWVTVSLALTDILGNVILVINKGEMRVKTQIGDFTYTGDRIIIKDFEKSNHTLLDMNLSNQQVKINSGQFILEYGDGFIINRKGELKIVTQGVPGLTFSECWNHDNSGGFGYINYDRFPDLKYPCSFGFRA